MTMANCHGEAKYLTTRGSKAMKGCGGHLMTWMFPVPCPSGSKASENQQWSHPKSVQYSPLRQVPPGLAFRSIYLVLSPVLDFNTSNHPWMYGQCTSQLSLAPIELALCHPSIQKQDTVRRGTAICSNLFNITPLEFYALLNGK